MKWVNTMNFPLPAAFEARMRIQLGAEADAYFAALDSALGSPEA